LETEQLRAEGVTVDCLGPLTAGAVYVKGKRVTGPGPDRSVVFQHPSLLPWRRVLGNVLYGLEAQGRATREARDRAASLINLVGLDGFEQAYPHELSGGMQQRVNLARALLMDPEVLLLDEPFASLDAQTREFMQEELLKIWSASRKTALFITHQISEAVFLSDRVIVFRGRPGRIREEVPVDLPRPRDLAMKRTAEFGEIEQHIWSLIETEARQALKDG
jgi:NitT/TauT family transport system ATP-binding protein